jgi:hypothetical protein
MANLEKGGLMLIGIRMFQRLLSRINTDTRVDAKIGKGGLAW